MQDTAMRRASAELGHNVGVKRWCLFIVWCVALALPLQGLAAASPYVVMGTMHDGALAAATQQAGEHPCHASADPVQSHEVAATGNHAGCAQCAACHAGSAPAPTTAIDLLADTQTSSPPTWRSPTLTAVHLDGPDRPPRLLLA